MNQKHGLCKWPGVGHLAAMSTVQEIEAVRAWIDDFLEDQLELPDEVKATLDESCREIAAGNYTTRPPK